MLSAELNISREKFDWEMEIYQIGSAIRYHNENPPAGTVLLNFFKGFEDSEGQVENVKVGNKEIKRTLPRRQPEKVIDIDKKKAAGAYNNSLESFVNLFGRAGGTVQ